MAPRASTHHANISAPLRNLERALAQQSRLSETFRRGALPVAPTRISAGPASFLISADPGPGAPLAAYAKTLAASNVKHAVRVCAPTYDPAPLVDAGFPVTDLYFEDGGEPPQAVVDAWLAILDTEFALRDAALVEDCDAPSAVVPGSIARPTVAIHCGFGVGRAPVLVALALIELGLDPFDAVATLRARRRGAINARQTAFLQGYVPRRLRPVAQLKPKSRSSSLLAAFLPKLVKSSGSRSAGSSRPSSPSSSTGHVSSLWSKAGGIRPDAPSYTPSALA